jgi:hypothetical protein
MNSNPFRHWVIDGWADVSNVVLPVPEWPHWIRYHSAFEQKRTCERPDLLPSRLRSLIDLMRSAETGEEIEKMTQMYGIGADQDLRGGGLHVTDPGGFLGVHLDYQIHPLRNLERRLNAVLFLNPLWDNSWGGALELWNSDASRAVVKIYPAPGRLVLFECGDESYHGVPAPLACPEGVCRATIATAFLSAPRGRRRALFVPVRV